MNLIEAQQRLDRLAGETARTAEDAKAAIQLADEDLARFERFHANTARLFNLGALDQIEPHAGRHAVQAIGRLRDGAQRRKAAATDRAIHAERISSHVAQLKADIAAHLQIRERGAAAGGLGERELYQN